MTPSGSLAERIAALRGDFDRDVQAAETSAALQAVRDRFLGRKAGALTELHVLAAHAVGRGEEEPPASS